MSSSASFGFIPWVKRGLGARIAPADGTGPAAANATFDVTLTFATETAGKVSTTTRLALLGPGEVAGINPKVIVRVDPPADTYDVEGNYFPLIEFDQADFPWRYAPARANAQERLCPWLALIVLADDEVTASTSAGTDGSLPTVTVAADVGLPDLTQGWAWAHVQVAGVDESDSEAEVQRIIDEEPDRVVSRLLCPRYLAPRTSYTAYLVPSFHRGVLAGLGLPPDDGSDGMVAAWEEGGGGVTLPVYFQWRFQTGESGDFESLVRRLLPPKRVPPTLGRIDMDVSAPGLGIAELADESPVAVEGALQPTEGVGAGEAPDFAEELAALVNTPALLLESGDSTRVVAPPLYGRWHAGRDRLEFTPGTPGTWFDEINADPTLRVAAGLGTAVVQSQQEQLMASAWEQVEGILEINMQRRQAQLATAVSERVYQREFVDQDEDATIQITAPVHSRIMASPHTIQAEIADSRIVDGTLDGQFRRMSRPLGPVAKRHGMQMQAAPGSLLDKMSSGELIAAPKNMQIEGLVTLSGVSGDVLSKLVSEGASDAAVGLWRDLRDGKPARSRLDTLPFDSDFVPRDPAFVGPGATEPIDGLPEDAAEAVDAFRDHLAILLDRISGAELQMLETAKRLDLGRIKSRIVGELDPRVNIPAAVNSQLEIATWIGGGGHALASSDSCEPVMASPEFDYPMFRPLTDLSKDWLLPGVGDVPSDTIALLQTNRRFIEAYMVGLNHEMARELLWREYPTDQRGTYFRQFWDVRGQVADGEEGVDSLRDIKPLHEWGDAALGENVRRPPPPEGHLTAEAPAGYLVLLIRGELLRRYPNTILYARRAARGSGGRVPTEEIRHHVFFGRLEPDVFFAGFDLTRDDVVGGEESTDGADQGWFFVLEEHPTEPRFGLDAPDDGYGERPESWRDLCWSHLVSGPDELGGFIDLTSELPLLPTAGADGLSWHAESADASAPATTASDLAWICLQRPYRVAIHGSDILTTAVDGGSEQ